MTQFRRPSPHLNPSSWSLVTHAWSHLGCWIATSGLSGLSRSLFGNKHRFASVTHSVTPDRPLNRTSKMNRHGKYTESKNVVAKTAIKTRERNVHLVIHKMIDSAARQAETAHPAAQYTTDEMTRIGIPTNDNIGRMGRVKRMVTNVIAISFTSNSLIRVTKAEITMSVYRCTSSAHFSK